MNTKELAIELNTEPKTLRRFLRTVLPKDTQPGRGSRYDFDTDAVAALKDAFASYTAKAARTITAADLVADEA